MISLPIRTKSGDNAHEHWRTKAQRAKVQRCAALLAFRAAWSKFTTGSPWFGDRTAALQRGLTITLTRVAPSELDDDGNASGMKSIRDGIADALGLKSDRSPFVTWKYAQRRAGVREYAVEVDIALRTNCPTCGAVS